MDAYIVVNDYLELEYFVLLYFIFYLKVIIALNVINLILRRHQMSRWRLEST